MSNMIEQLRTEARKQCDRHNNVDQFTPSWQRKPKDFIEWKAADEIERLTNLLEYAGNEIKDGRKEIERLQAVADAAERIYNRKMHSQSDEDRLREALKGCEHEWGTRTGGFLIHCRKCGDIQAAPEQETDDA